MPFEISLLLVGVKGHLLFELAHFTEVLRKFFLFLGYAFAKIVLGYLAVARACACGARCQLQRDMERGIMLKATWA